MRLFETRLARFGMRWWYWLFQTAAKMLGAALFQVRVYGAENVPPKGGLILASNHQCYMDPAFIAACMNREVHFMARSTLFRNPAFKALIVTLNAFPIERDRRDVKGVKEALRRLKAGHALLVFPEGTRTRDGTIGPMRAGIRFLAERAAAPIVPVLIEGAYEAWPKGAPLPSMGRVNIIFGRPVDFAEGGDGAVRLRRAIAVLGVFPHRRVTRRKNVESQTGG